MFKDMGNSKEKALLKEQESLKKELAQLRSKVVARMESLLSHLCDVLAVVVLSMWNNVFFLVMCLLSWYYLCEMVFLDRSVGDAGSGKF